MGTEILSPYQPLCKLVTVKYVSETHFWLVLSGERAEGEGTGWYILTSGYRKVKGRYFIEIGM